MTPDTAVDLPIAGGDSLCDLPGSGLVRGRQAMGDT